MKNYKDKNIALIQKLHPNLYRTIKELNQPCPGTVVRNNVGEYNLRFADGSYLHNFDSPWREADEHLTMLPDDFDGIALFCGFGLGYWPLRMLAQGHTPALTIIIEPSVDIFLTALEVMDLSPLLTAENVLFFIGDVNWQEYEALVTRTALFETTCLFRLYAMGKQREESYKEVDDQAFGIMNSLNIQGSTLCNKGPVFFDNSLRNLTLLPHSPPMNCLRGLFKNKPAIVVAAGPSLNKDINVLRQLKGRCVIIAVDSAAKPLFEAGITPDFITTIDFQELNIEKIAPLLGQNWPIALVALIKGSPIVPKTFRGTHTFLAFQDDEPDTWLTKALGVDCYVSSGSSVAHLGLGLARILASSPICFLGQDLAFGEIGRDHARGTVFAGDGLPEDQKILCVPGIGNTEVKTSRCFLEFRNQFELIIKQHPNRYINLTSNGAKIHGTEEMSIAAAAKEIFREELQVQNKVEQAISQSSLYNIEGFLDRSSAMLKKIGKILRQIAKIERLIEKETGTLLKVRKKKRKIRDVTDLPPGSQKNIGRIDRLNNMIDEENTLWHYLQAVSLKMFHKNQKCLTANQKLREQGNFSQWLAAELARIGAVNSERKEILTNFQPLLTNLNNHLREVMLLSEDDFTVNLRAARVHLKAGNIHLAARALEQYDLPDALKAEQQSVKHKQAHYYFLHGIVMANFLKLDQADEDWHQALLLDQSFAGEIISNRQKQARRWFEHLSIEFEQNLMEMWIDRAVLLASHLSASEVKAVYQDMDTIPKYLALFARRLLEHGSFEAGIAVLQDAVNKDPATAGLWEEIGDVLINDNDIPGAMQAYRNCYMAQSRNTWVLEKFKMAAARIAN